MARRSHGRGTAAVVRPAADWLVPTWIAGTIVAATVERWWFPRAWDETGLMASRLYHGDARAYLSYAAALLDGETFDNGVPFHPPGWPLVLAVALKALGWSSDSTLDLLAIKHVVAVISGVSVGLTALLTFVLAGRRAMIVASLLGTFHFGHLVQSASPNSEPLYGLLVIAVLLYGVWCLNRRPSAAHATAWGALAGLTTLVRAEFAMCALLLAGTTILLRGRLALKSGALFALGFILVLVPTTITNWRSIDGFNRTREGRMPGSLPRFAPITSYGAFNFANANHGAATGGFNFDLPSLALAENDETREATDLNEAGLLDLSRPAVYQAYVDGYRMGLEWLIGHPSQGFRLVLSKLSITFSMFDYGYLLDNVPSAVVGLRRPVDQVDLETSWLTVLHAGLAVLGLVLACRRRASMLIVAPVLTMLVASMLFFGYVRLGVAYLPVIWVLQALAVVRMTARLTAPMAAEGRVFAVAAAVAGLLLLHDASAAGDRRVLRVDGVVDETGTLVDDQMVRIERIR